MKKTLILLLICFVSIFSFAPHTQANIGIIKLSWTVPSVTETEAFNFYYSYNSDMTDKKKHTICGSLLTAGTNTFHLECANVPIEQFPAYIQIIWEPLEGGQSLFSNIQQISEHPGTPQAVPFITNIIGQH